MALGKYTDRKLLSKYTERKRPTLPAGTTHVAEWSPAYLYGDGARPSWDLQTRAYFERGASCGIPEEWTTEFPREVNVLRLADWVTGVLGYPVTLTPGTQQIKPWGRLSRYLTEPIYYVSRRS
jgi:hypothetical protein